MTMVSINTSSRNTTVNERKPFAEKRANLRFEIIQYSRKKDEKNKIKQISIRRDLFVCQSFGKAVKRYRGSIPPAGRRE